MRKKRENSAQTGPKPAGKGSFSLLPVLFGVGVALALVLLTALLMAALISGGVVPAESPSFLLSVCAGLCALVGARVSIRKGSLAPMVGGMVHGAAVCAVFLLISLGCQGSIAFHGQFAGTLLMILAGSCLAGLFGKPKAKKKKK